MSEEAQMRALCERLGASPAQAATMAAQLLKRAAQLAVERGITREAALSYLLNLVVMGRNGEVPTAPPPAESEMGLRRNVWRCFVGRRGSCRLLFTMNKAELISAVKKRLGAETSLAAAERAVDAVLGAVGQGIKRDREVQLVGFGSFSVATRAARRGYNPHTRQPMKIRAMKTIRFKAGLDLKAAV